VTISSVVEIETRADVERARREARTLALRLGFGRDDAERVTLAVSELAANLLKYAQDGRIVASSLEELGAVGIQIESLDIGPGIDDIPNALRDGFSTGGGLGSGLPCVVRMMDEITIESSASGTHIMTRKWLIPAS
jgi:serine/threonine-protein kinase RsbT